MPSTLVVQVNVPIVNVWLAGTSIEAGKMTI
jgi:hypothetical protein